MFHFELDDNNDSAKVYIADSFHDFAVGAQHPCIFNTEILNTKILKINTINLLYSNIKTTGQNSVSVSLSLGYKIFCKPDIGYLVFSSVMSNKLMANKWGSFVLSDLVYLDFDSKGVKHILVVLVLSFVISNKLMGHRWRVSSEADCGAFWLVGK